MASDGLDVYWLEANQAAGSIFRVPVDGGAFQMLSDTPAGYVALAIDGDAVYWPALQSGVNRVPKAGGSTTLLPAGQSVQAVAFGGGRIFWAEGGTLGPIVVKSTPVAGGPIAVLAAGNFNRTVERIAVDDATVYLLGAGFLSTVPVTGGSLVQMNSVGPCMGIASDDIAFYWTGTDGTINKITHADGVTVRLAIGQSPRAVAIDDSSVYWTEARSVRRIAKSGGVAVELARGDNGPAYDGRSTSIAVDGKSVYWADGSGAILRTAK